MSEHDHDPAPGGRGDAPAADADAGPASPASGDPADPPEPVRPGDRPDSEEDKQATTIINNINNFYDAVSAGMVGVSSSADGSAKAVIRPESGVLALDEIRRALRYYLRPAEFDRALEMLTSRHLIAVAGPEGCGKRAATLELARAACPGAESFTVFPPTRSLAELALYKGYRPGQAYLIHDWTPVSDDPRSIASYDLEQLAARLRTANAYLAITFEGGGQRQVLFGDMCVTWSAPEPAALFDHCAGLLAGLRLADPEREQLRARAAELRLPRLIVRLAEAAAKSGVTAALAVASETESGAIAAWFEAMPARWKVWAVASLAFLSGVREREFERQTAVLADADARQGTGSADDEHRDEPDEDDPFPQRRWKLANDASLEAFISERNPGAPVGSEHRPAFRTKACRLHFMMELNRRFGDDLWTPVRDWLFALADEQFGEAQIAAGYGLALLARCALGEVEDSYLAPWSAGDLLHRLTAVSVLWAMAEDDLVAPAALRITVGWVQNKGQERAITAAIAFGGPLGQRYPSEAMRWLWILALRSERIGRVARVAMSQLFAVEAEADLEKGTVVRFLLQKIRSVLRADVTARERRAALEVVNSVLGTMRSQSEVPAMASVLRTRPADFRPIGELWAAVLNSAPHREAAVRALHLTLAALADDTDSVDLAERLGAAILPRLTTRSVQILELALPDPGRALEISASVVRAFLDAQRHPTGAIR